MTLPTIVILATGGTIVSSGASSTQMTGYSIQGVRIDDIITAVPALAEIANIRAESVANIDSMNMTSAVWIALARRIEALAQDPAVKGFVVTHGTDTMEETAYFLHLVLKTAKPVVMTGAMRPSTALSADGPLNLLNAVRVAASPQSRGKGVLLALNDKILSGRDAAKSDPTNAETFTSENFGALGLIAGRHIEFFRAPVRRHTIGSEFQLPDELPRVDIVYSHADDDGMLVRACVAAGAQGIVHAGTGNGSIHENTEPALCEAIEKGVIVIRASRLSRGMTEEGLARWQEVGMIPAGTLSSQKARVLLQLALTVTQDPAQVKRIFSEY